MAWNDEARLAQGIDHLYLDEGDPTAPEGGAMNDTIAQVRFVVVSRFLFRGSSPFVSLI